MINKRGSSDPIDNLEYEKVLEEEIINSYESKFQKDPGPDKKKTNFYRLKRTPLEIGHFSCSLLEVFFSLCF